MTAPTTRRSAAAARTAQLSEDEIVAASLRIVAREGLGSLTIRRLCDDLRVTAPAIYYYVPNKRALIERVAEAVVKPVQIPREGDWRERLIELSERVRDAYLRYPGLARYARFHRLSPTATTLADAVLGMLMEGGLDEAAALEAYDVLTALTFGQLIADPSDRVPRGRRPRRVGFLPQTPPAAELYPTLAQVRATLGTLDAGDTHRRGMELLLRGIVPQPSRRRKR
ncbi:MAG TPA: TetR/AcrR family transcriptional regulator [Mycobacteriales bacterium]|jgi:AcrR family transcriptional regulator|nr:TetR/AcrR family transcriptional regulator [Mycobacteriales bacterium]